jgi:hypothetical protein
MANYSNASTVCARYGAVDNSGLLHAAVYIASAVSTLLHGCSDLLFLYWPPHGIAAEVL